MPKSPSIQWITAGGLCAGCGLCQAMFPNKVQLTLNNEGYLRPITAQPLDGEERQQLSQVCPGVLVKHEPSDVAYNREWGPLVAVRTGYATDQETRHLGSSGGVLSALLIYLLESRQIDFVAHIKVATDDPLGNEMSISRTKSEVLTGAGSRYAPSAPLGKLNELLAMPGRFAIVGKPCDIAALRQYEQLNPSVTGRIPFMLSFMCAGIPSRKGTEAILAKFGVNPEQVKTFAYRGNGWPGKTTAITRDGQTHQTDYSTSWGSVLNRHLQFRCKICPDGVGEFADVVGADAWYGKDGYPDFTERDGRSLVLTRTRRGETLVQEALAAGVLATNDLPVEEIAKMQPYQLQRKQLIFSRVGALRAFGRPAPKYVNFPLLRLATKVRLRDNVRSFLGTVRRALF